MEKIENKKSEAKKVLNDLDKTIKRIHRMTMFIIFWLKFMRYLVLWLSVLTCAAWSLLPVAFFWTGDYLYLKLFGTFPFCIIAFYFIFYGISEHIKFSSKKSDDKYKQGGSIYNDKNKESLTSALANQEKVIMNTTETTIQLLRATSVF